MIKRYVLVALAFNSLTLCAKADTEKNLADSAKTYPVKIKVKPVFADSLFIVPAVENPLLSYQNIVYKQRLDSIVKTVPLTYNEYVQNYIDIYCSRRKEDFSKVLGLCPYYFPIYEKALKALNIPEELKYLSIVESTLNPNAVSHSGAVGLWQFMFTTAKGYHLKMDDYVDERKDPVASSNAAAAYFRDAFNELGDWLLVVASFNCGKGAVTRAIAKAGGEANFWAIRSFLPLETRNYVPAFIATAYLMNYHEKHGIVAATSAFPAKTNVVDIDKRISLSAVAKVTGIDSEALSILNPSYKKRIINGTTDQPGQLVLPALDNTLLAALDHFLHDSSEPQAPVEEVTFDGKSSSKAFTHTVAKGEMLNSIAETYHVTVQDLKVWNNLKTSNLVPGQNLQVVQQNTIQIPENVSGKYISYTVKPGDTLLNISSKFNGSVSEIKAINRLKGQLLKPGMVLKITKG